MLTEKQHFDIQDFFAKEVQGAVCKGHDRIFEDMIEAGVITQEFFNENETEICGIFDDGWFTCLGCDWTLPMSEMSICGDWSCTDCEPEDED